MPLNLQLGNVSIPGSNTRRASADAGEGFMVLGKSLSDAARVLSSIEEEEDDIIGLDFSLRYGQDLNDVITTRLSQEPNIRKHRDIIRDITREVTKAYTKAAREAGVPKGFSRHAFSQAVTIQNNHLRDTSARLGQLGISTIKKSEQMTSSSMIDEGTGRIPTVIANPIQPGRELKTGKNNKVIRLHNEGDIANKIRSHFDIMMKQRDILPVTTDINQELLAYSQRLTKSILDSVAQNHADLFTEAEFKGARISIEIPFLDAQGNVEMKTITPDQEQLNEMIDKAEIQAAKNAQLREKKQLQEMKALELRDDASLSNVYLFATDPTIKLESLQRLYQHVAGQTSFYRPEYVTDQAEEPLHDHTQFKFSSTTPGNAKRRQALDYIAERIKTSPLPVFNNKALLKEARRKLWDNEPFTQADFDKYQSGLDEATYQAIWDKAKIQKNTVQSDLDKERQEARVSIRRLLGNMPGSFFTEHVGVVSDKAEEDFMTKLDRIQAIKGDQITSDDIAEARYEALNGIIDYIAKSSVSDTALEVISRYTDKTLPNGDVYTVADQIEDAYKDKTNNAIRTRREYYNALVYANIKKAAGKQKKDLDNNETLGGGIETRRMKQLKALKKAQELQNKKDQEKGAQ